MLLDRWLPNRGSPESDRLRRAAELHAISSLAVTREVRKTERRAGDMRVVADAAERRSRERIDRPNEIYELVDTMLNGAAQPDAGNEGQKPC